MPAATVIKNGEDRLGRALLFADRFGGQTDLPAGLGIADGAAPLDHGEADAVRGFTVKGILPLHRKRPALAGLPKILNRLVEINVGHIAQPSGLVSS